jgi:hypothetical protein
MQAVFFVFKTRFDVLISKRKKYVFVFSAKLLGLSLARHFFQPIGVSKGKNLDVKKQTKNATPPPKNLPPVLQIVTQTLPPDPYTLKFQDL